MTLSFSVIPQGCPLCFLRLRACCLDQTLCPAGHRDPLAATCPDSEACIMIPLFLTWALPLNSGPRACKDQGFPFQLLCLFVFIRRLALRQFHFVSQAGLKHIMFLPLHPESGIHYRYTKPYQSLLSIFFFSCWDRAAPSSGLVWVKCKCPIFLWVICRFYLIPQKLSSLRAIALPPRLLKSPTFCPCRILSFYYIQSESEKSRVEFGSQSKLCFLTLTSNVTLTWPFKFCSTILIISHFLMPFIKTVEKCPLSRIQDNLSLSSIWAVLHQQQTLR